MQQVREALLKGAARGETALTIDDTVTISECRPLSKSAYRLGEITERAVQV